MTLYILGTPIGNLEDISLRALKILREKEIFLAEEPTRLMKIFNKYGIPIKGKKILKYNARVEEDERLVERVIAKLMEMGEDAVLTVSGGMPGISDPGAVLIKKMRERGVNITVVPSATALTTALSLSGIHTKTFFFLGFPPKKYSKKVKYLKEYSNLNTVLILYESPHQIEDLIKAIKEVFPPRTSICIARELTKIHEEIVCARLENIEFNENWEKGEIVVIIDNRDYSTVE